MKVSHASSLMSGARVGATCPPSVIPSSAINSSYSSSREHNLSGGGNVRPSRFDKRSFSSIVSLHPVVGTADGKGRPTEPQAQSARGRSGGVLRAPAATGLAREPSSPRASSSLRAGWCWLTRAARRLDNHWIGDLIGAVCLFGMLWIGLVAAMVFE